MPVNKMCKSIRRLDLVGTMGHTGYALVSIVPNRSSYSYFLHTFVNPAYNKHLFHIEVFPYSGKNAHIIAKLEF